MAKIEAIIQGINRDFKFTGSFDVIELGAVTLLEAPGLMRKLPDEGGVTPEFLKGEGELCPPYLILSFTRMVKEGLLRKRLVRGFVTLMIVGGGERGKVQVRDETTQKPKFAVVSFSEADEIISHFFRKASEEPAFPAGTQRLKGKRRKGMPKFVWWGLIGLLVLGWLVWFFSPFWAQMREVPSIDDPQIVVFQTGLGLIVLIVIGALFGLSLAAAGIFSSYYMLMALILEFGKLRDRLENFGLLLVTLLVLASGVFLFYVVTYEYPRSERVVIDEASETIKIEKYYLIRPHTELQVAFKDISHIKYYQWGMFVGQWAIGPNAEVELVTWDGREVKVSSDGPRFQYRLARAISGATGRPLEE